MRASTRTVRRPRPAASRSRRVTPHVGESQHTAESHVRDVATKAFSSPKLVRNWLAERSGNAETRPVLDVHARGAEFTDNRSKSPRFTAVIASLAAGASFGVRRALPGVVTALELAVGAFEIVLVEAALRIRSAHRC